MKNELEMIQTLFEYQNFGLIPFPCKPFSKDIHDSSEGRLLYLKAVKGIQMTEDEIYKWFGEKKLDNCGLILGEKGNLSILEFDGEEKIETLYKDINNLEESVSNLIFKNFIENLFESTTTILTPEKKIQFWFKYSNKLPTYRYFEDHNIDFIEGISIYSDNYIVAPPSFIRSKNFVDQYEIVFGKQPIMFPNEIDFFEKKLSK